MLVDSRASFDDEDSVDRGMEERKRKGNSDVHTTTLYAFPGAARCLLEQVLFIIMRWQLPRVQASIIGRITKTRRPLDFFEKHRHRPPIAKSGRPSAFKDVMAISVPGSKWFKLVVWAKETAQTWLLQPHCLRHNLG